MMVQSIMVLSIIAAGRAAYAAGLPCVAPEYGRKDYRACWRVGWKRQQAADGKLPVRTYRDGFIAGLERAARVCEALEDDSSAFTQHREAAAVLAESIRQTVKEA